MKTPYPSRACGDERHLQFSPRHHSLETRSRRPDNEVRHDFSKGESLWRETNVPHAQEIEGFTNGFIPSMLLVESDLIALIGGRLRYHLAMSKAEFRFDLHRAVKGLRDSISVLMWDKS